jgi:hypothetical protein
LTTERNDAIIKKKDREIEGLKEQKRQEVKRIKDNDR